MKKILFSLSVILILTGCKPTLTNLEKSDLLVQAEKVQNFMCNENGSYFYNLYKDLLNNTGDGDTEKKLRNYLDQNYSGVIEKVMIWGTKLETDNLALRAKKIAKEINFYKLSEMEGLAENLANINNFRMISERCSR